MLDHCTPLARFELVAEFSMAVQRQSKALSTPEIVMLGNVKHSDFLVWLSASLLSLLHSSKDEGHINKLPQWWQLGAICELEFASALLLWSSQPATPVSLKSMLKVKPPVGRIFCIAHLSLQWWAATQWALQKRLKSHWAIRVGHSFPAINDKVLN